MPFMVLANSTNSPVVSRNIAPTRPQMITESLSPIGTLKLNSESLGKFEDIPSDTELFLPGQDTSKLANIIQANYTFSTVLKNKLNEVINDLYSESSAGTGRISSLHYSDVDILLRMSNNVSILNSNLDRVSDSVGSLDRRLNAVEDSALIDGFITTNTLHMPNPAQGASKWAHFYLSNLINKKSKYADLYVDKSKDWVGYYIVLNSAINDPAFNAGKVYKIYISGNKLSRLILRNMADSNSKIAFMPIGCSLNKDFVHSHHTVMNSTGTNTYEQIEFTNSFLFYTVEIEKSALRMYVTVNASNVGMAPKTNVPYDVPITGVAGNWTGAISQDVVNSGWNLYGRRNVFDWALTEKVDGARSADKKLAVTVVTSANTHPFERLRVNLTYKIRPGNNGIPTMKVYTYSHDNTLAGSFSTTVGEAESVTTVTKSVILKYSGKLNGKNAYKAYIRVKCQSGSSWKGFRIGVSAVGSSATGNP